MNSILPMIYPSLQVTNGEEFLPNSISGLVAWWDASENTFSDEAATTPQNTLGGVVRAWRDKVSNILFTEGVTSAPILQTQASLNGLRVIRFSGAQRMVAGDVLDLHLNNMAIFMVTTIRGGNQALIGKSLFPRPVGAWSFFYEFYPPAFGIGTVYEDTGPVSRLSRGALIGSVPDILLWDLNRTAGTSIIYNDGATQATITPFADTDTDLDTTLGLSIGSIFANTILYAATGDIAEILIYQRAKTDSWLTSAEYNQIAAYLSDKYNIVWSNIT